MHKRLEAMKQNLACAIEAQLCNLGEVDCEELGEAIDMLKDLEEALYFCTITEAMNGGGKYGNVEIEYENGHKKNGHHQNGNDQMYYSYPMMYNDGGRMYSNGNGNGNRSYNDGMMYNDGWNGRYYNDGMSYNDGGSSQMYYPQRRDSRGRFMSDYTEPTYERDHREGRSPMNRRMYMEAKGTKDKATQLRELEKYMQELTSDMVEMIQDSSPEEKQYLEKKISALATKIGQMK